MPALKRGQRVFLAGHRGLVGSAIARRLREAGHEPVLTRTRSELDLTDQAAVRAFLASERPVVVIVAAAKVGGIQANRSAPADFIGQNLLIQDNLIWGSHEAGVGRLLFLGSSCIYPRETAQPIPEEALLTGPLEPTNAPYAIAKIAGLTLCRALRHQYGRDYFTVMPPNVYGPGDNFDPENSHVMAAMVRRFVEADPSADVTCWGSGTPKREFLFVDDLADACAFLLGLDDVPDTLNVGTGEAVTIRRLAETVQAVAGHRGAIRWDASKPDGFPEKTMDVSRLTALGWRPKTSLEDGVRRTVEWFRQSVPEVR